MVNVLSLQQALSTCMRQPPYHLFDVVGVELEYMIVDAQSGQVLPVCDEVLRAAAGDLVSEVERGPLAWSNELALHVIELKTNGPVAQWDGLGQAFHGDVLEINRLLEPLHGRLMPTAMHPWMDPLRELHLWPHDYNPVYEAFHRIFDCRGHGWANLQSVHLNLPFCGDDEFGKLHAAIRLLLPILPALAASSPLMESRLTGVADNRLDVYRFNARRVPSIAGQIVPEPVYTRGDYEAQILARLYRDIAPFDPEGILQYEWLNARGAIARFDRQAIEIRVLDIQECPAADLAICRAIVAVLRRLVAQEWRTTAEQQAFATEPLARLLLGCIRDAHQYVIEDRDYLCHFGIAEACPAGDVWRTLLAGTPECGPELRVILDQGPLSARIARAVQSDQRPLAEWYALLCDALRENRPFVP